MTIGLIFLLCRGGAGECMRGEIPTALTVRGRRAKVAAAV